MTMINRRRPINGATVVASLIVFLVVVSNSIVNAFHIPSHRPLCHRPLCNDNNIRKSAVLYMIREEADKQTNSSPSEDDNKSSEIISDYKTKLDPRRSYTNKPRPGSTAPTSSIDVTMKFGGSSLANAERVDRVAHLIKDRIRPPPNDDGSESDEIPVRPRAGKFVYYVHMICALLSWPLYTHQPLTTLTSHSHYSQHSNLFSNG